VSSRIASDVLLLVDRRCEVMVRSRERVRFATPRFGLLRFSPENAARFIGFHTTTQGSSLKPFFRDAFRKFSPTLGSNGFPLPRVVWTLQMSETPLEIAV